MRLANTVTKTIVYLLGFIATLAFIITKDPSLLASITSGDSAYGDLYRFTKVKNFKPAAPLTTGRSGADDSIDAGQALPNEFQDILVGDSFSFRDWGDKTFHGQLQEAVGGSWFCVHNNHHRSYWENPQLLLEAAGESSHPERVLVYEIVERSIQNQFADFSPAKVAQQSPADISAGPFHQICDDVFKDQEMGTLALIKHNAVTASLLEWWKTFMFNKFGSISPDTPVYSLKPPFLFYSQTIACYNTTHDDQLVARLAANIAAMGDDLQRRFHYTLLFVPVPNKITIYSHYVAVKPYDNFLPRLCRDLNARGVNTVDLVSVFQAQTQTLYMATDTHWNNLGIQIAVQETAKRWPRNK